MHNFYTLLASKKITMNVNGDVIYHISDRFGNGYSVNLSKEFKILSATGYDPPSMEEVIRLYQELDYDYA